MNHETATLIRALPCFSGIARIAALDGGMKDMDPPFDSAAAAWLRLPFQLPLFWLAWRVARGGRAAA